MVISSPMLISLFAMATNSGSPFIFTESKLGVELWLVNLVLSIEKTNLLVILLKDPYSLINSLIP